MKGVMLDFDSLKRLGLDKYPIDQKKSFEITSPSTIHHTIIIHLLKSKNIVCTNCGASNGHKVLRTKIQTLKYSSPFNSNIDIILYRRVYRCKDCDKTFKEANTFAQKRARISNNKIKAISKLFYDKHLSFVDIAKQMKISVTTILKIFDKNFKIQRLKLPTVLSIDEVYRKHLTKTKYCCVLFDQFQNQIIDIIESRRYIKLKEYFSLIPKQELDSVNCITIDLYKTYKSIAATFFPNAKICADSFHVIKNIHYAFNKIRVEIMNQYIGLKKYSGSAYAKYKKYWKLLFEDPGKLNTKISKKPLFEKEISCVEIVDQLLDIDQRLRTAYELMTEYKIFNQSELNENSKERLKEIIKKFSNSEFEQYQKIGLLLGHWIDEIINSFTIVNNRRVSNGPMEHINRMIKDYLRISYSARDFERARNRLMLIITSKK